MASATSCFNATYWRKTMARFWPLWSLYGVIWLFVIPLNLLNNYFDMLRWQNSLAEAQDMLFTTLEDLPRMLEPGVLLAVVYGALSAMAVFGYLYNNRSACMTHALPLRRDTLFFTQYTAGISFFLLPHLASGLLGTAVTLVLLPAAQWGEGLSYILILLAAQTAISLFFFSFAAFCAMFTGHILALPAFYGILNALVIVIYSIVAELMNSIFFGFAYSYNNDLVRVFTPVYALMEASHWNSIYPDFPDPVTGEYVLLGYEMESPATLAIYAGVGVLFALAALMVYRRRHIESAGDVVSVPVVRPIFRVGVSFCAGLCLGLFTAIFFGWTNRSLHLSLCILFWAAVGWFAAEMLLKKSFRVWKAWKSCLVMVAALAVLCAAFFCDWFGIETRVPQASEVASLTITTELGAPYDSGEYFNTTLEDEDEIQRFIDIHQAIVNDRARLDSDSYSYESGENYVRLYLNYTMTDGSVMERRYRSIPVYEEELDTEGSVTWHFAGLLADRELVERCYGFDTCEQGRLVEASLQNVRNERGVEDYTYLAGAATEDLEGLWKAVRADFDAGDIGVRYLFPDSDERYANTYVTDLQFTFAPPDSADQKEASVDVRHYSYNFSITLTPQAKNTLTWLEEHNVLGGKYSLLPHDVRETIKHQEATSVVVY